MGHSVTIGGERLGSGNKMKAYLREYERSTHDRGLVVKTTMAPGTLVPFLSEIATPGTTMDINLAAMIQTHPTIGPLFGLYKFQMDIYQAPIRLYQGLLHMNALNIGMDMSKVYLPRISMEAAAIDKTKLLDNQQINPSAIYSHLGIRGNGFRADGTAPLRSWNAIPTLAYWDIYKQYYANKQEEIGAVIHKPVTETTTALTNAELIDSEPPVDIPLAGPIDWTTKLITFCTEDTAMFLSGSAITAATDPDNLKVTIQYQIGSLAGDVETLPATELFEEWAIDVGAQTIVGRRPKGKAMFPLKFGLITFNNAMQDPSKDLEPQITTFPLTNIDDMRKALLSHFSETTPYYIDSTTQAPYGLPLQSNTIGGKKYYSMQYGQEGLAIKTYNSDLFNNWISTEWIDGPDGISAITSIDTTGGSITIDEINLSSKIYVMLNRIALSGGTYDDWLDAVYTHERQRSAENPMYMGGLIKDIVFEEIVSNAATPEQPLGTLAGRGRFGGKHKGGHVVIKVDEPSYIIGICSITPYVDYSQGNKWDNNLITMNDLHKPQLDEIGFQDLITDQMAWFDTEVAATGGPVFKSAGKQPAWINYMTNVNVVRGNFADQSQQMFMVLNRRYSYNYNGVGAGPAIADLTTYIDPTKFNHIFADTRRDAQNFWVQMGVDITARQKMSAKVIPNL